jgi:MSHA biogenesis protein MshP
MCPEFRCPTVVAPPRRAAPRGRVRGLSIITAIFMLILMAGVAAYLMALTASSQGTSAQDVMGTRAYQAARSGAEWASYVVLKIQSNVGFCAGASDTRTLAAGGAGSLAGGLADFTVTVNCTRTTHNEGGTTVRVYRMDATACYPSATCPAASPPPNYVERQVTMVVWR